MKESKMKVQIPVRSSDSDEKLIFLKQMGIENAFVMFEDQHSNYDDVMFFKERCSKYGITINDAGNVNLYKKPSIHLGLPDRDYWIEKYNNFNKVLAKAEIKVGYITWDTGRVSTTKFSEGKYNRSSISRIVDMNELKSRPLAFDRVYDENEIWSNFKYFLDNVLPVCEDIKFRLALHPNDPPVPALEGVYNLIHSADDYKRAFALSKNSPYLGMKLCVGCWLEGGTNFGDLLNDIEYFVKQNKVFIVHFRNVSHCLPAFEETLIEDGYMNMYQVIKTLVANNYTGTIHCDHVPKFVKEFGGTDTSFSYATGYLKGLIHAAYDEQ